jgi:hypothetical protein
VSATAIGSIVFACVFGSALLAMFARAALPEHHLSAHLKDVVKLGMALIATIPVPFLVVLVFGRCIIFASFGLFAPRNATVIAVLGVCALSVSGAIFLIPELDRSFEGIPQVSGAPLRAALAQLGQ